MAEVPLEYLRALTKALNLTVEQGQKQVRSILEGLIANGDYATPEELVADALDYLEPLFETVSENSAALSAQSYDFLRTANLGYPLGAAPYNARRDGELRDALYSIATKHPTNMDAFVSEVLDRMDYEAKRASGTTTVRNGFEDRAKPRFARVPTGPETCRFCVMLASRGFVYHSEKTAGALNHFHPNCDCRIVPGFEGMVLDDYDPDEYLDLWVKMEEEGIDKLESPNHAESDPIDREASVYKRVKGEYVDKISRTVAQAPEPVRKLYQRFEGNFALKRGKGDRAFFSSNDCAVSLDLDYVFGDDSTSPLRTGTTWFHEFGHAIDYMSTGTEPYREKMRSLLSPGGGHRASNAEMYASARYKDGLFERTLRREVEGRISALTRARSKEVGELLDALDFERLVQRGYITERERKICERRVAGRSSADRFLSSSLADVIRSRGDEDSTCRYLGRQIRDMDYGVNQSISDIYEGATMGKVRDGWAHGERYWTQTGALGREAFAEFYSAAMRGDPEEVRLIEEWFPESRKVFDDIVDAIGRGEV